MFFNVILNNKSNLNNLFHTREGAPMHNIKYTESESFKCLENLRKTSLDLYLIHTGVEHCTPSHICPGPKDEFIIHFVLSGRGVYTCRKHTWQLRAGEMFLIYPNEHVTYASDAEDPWSYAWIGFNGIRANTALTNCGFSQHTLARPFHDPDQILEKIHMILESRQLTFAADLNRNACLLQILAKLCNDYAMHAPQESRQRRGQSKAYLAHAIEYIEYSYPYGINVTDIVDYIGISRTYLNRIFKKELGVSVQTFLINYCLHKAASLLVSTDSTVHEIAKAVGYEDPLAFSKAFKKKFGKSPKNYREHKDLMDKFSEKQPWIK